MMASKKKPTKAAVDLPPSPQEKPRGGRKKLSPIPSQVKTKAGESISKAQTGVPKPHYSDDEKALIMALLCANGDNLRQTSEETGTPYDTLLKWRNGNQIHSSVIVKESGIRMELVEKINLTMHACVDEMITPSKLHKTSGPQLAVMFGILAEKWRLLQEKPTVILGREGEDDSVLKRLFNAVERLRQRAVAPGNGAGGGLVIESRGGGDNAAGAGGPPEPAEG